MWEMKRIEEKNERPGARYNKETLGSARALNSQPFPLPSPLFSICPALCIFLRLYHEKRW